MEIRPLTNEERSALKDGLKLAARFVAHDLPLSASQVQDLYDAIRIDHPDNVEAQIAVGLAFGETIARKAGFEWVRVKDDYGEETALSPKGIQIACHPISMLQKRIASREPVAIEELRDATIKSVEERIASEDYRRR